MSQQPSVQPVAHRPGEEGRRNELILTAARLFREQGYERTTVRELAGAVGLQSGSLFHHFRNKEEILLAVMANGIQSEKKAWQCWKAMATRRSG